MFSVHYKYEKIVFQVCILDQFPEFMTCGTFKSTPFRKKIIIKKKKEKTKKCWGESLEAETRWVRMARKKLSQVQVNVIFLVKS